MAGDEAGAGGAVVEAFAAFFGGGGGGAINDAGGQARTVHARTHQRHGHASGRALLSHALSPLLCSCAHRAGVLRLAPCSLPLRSQALVEAMDGADFFVPAPSTAPGPLSATLLASMSARPPGPHAAQGNANLIEEALRREAERKLQ